MFHMCDVKEYLNVYNITNICTCIKYVLYMCICWFYYVSLN